MIQRQPLIVPFTKMSGAGNDFIVLDNRFLHFSEDELEALAKRFCPRRTGIGADGLLALDPPETGTSSATGHSPLPTGPPEASGATDFRMRYRNADGSRAGMCGNGARCLARFAARAGLGTETPDGTRLAFMTDGGRYTALVTPEAPVTVTLDVPPPRDFRASGAASDLGDVHSIWTGTEHAVVFVDNVEDAPVATEGERLRHDPDFAPAGTNVNFVQLENASGVPGSASGAGSGRVRVRTFEKGVEGETLACGTGAMASALVARLAGKLDADFVDVEMPGGTLGVGFQIVDGEVRDLTLSGPAETIYEGTLEWLG